MTDGGRNIVLAGDSIFDNDSYVLGELGLIEQMRRSMPDSWSAYKIAVDGDCISDVYGQLESLPTHVTDLVLSVGGNDARKYRSLINRIKSPHDIKDLLESPLAQFRSEYSALITHLLSVSENLTVCNIYTKIPFEEPVWRLYAPIAIGKFNSVIEDVCLSHQVSVVRLDEICVQELDFSSTSPIEPSSIGGQKIVDALIQHLRNGS